jgi:hypothetical protein
MSGEDGSAFCVGFALPDDSHSGPFEPEVESAHSCE